MAISGFKIHAAGERGGQPTRLERRSRHPRRIDANQTGLTGLWSGSRPCAGDFCRRPVGPRWAVCVR